MISHRISAKRLVALLGTWRGGGASYVELASSIELLARDGALTPGTMLPAERALAEAAGISRTTVSAAYLRLRETGIAMTRQGSGTVLRSLRPRTVEQPFSQNEISIDFTKACPEPWSGLPRLGELASNLHKYTFLLEGYDTLGSAELREAIAERYRRRGLPTSADQIMVTLGAQHAIYLIARTILSRGDRALIEAPSYPHAREALAATGALVADLPIGNEGHDTEVVLETVRRTAPKLSYLIPDHHNPTGLSMAASLRTQLIAQLSAQGGFIIADETTAELCLREPALLPPFAAATSYPHERERILTVGSLSKTVWGGLRVGWIRAAPELITRLGASRRVSDLGTGNWDQLLALLALERYDEILADRSRALTARHRVLVEQVGALLPDWRLSQASGGVCLWADLSVQRSLALSRTAAVLGLRLAPGVRFGSPGVFDRFVRLPFSLAEEDLVRGVQILAEAWAMEPRLHETSRSAGVVI